MAFFSKTWINGASKPLTVLRKALGLPAGDFPDIEQTYYQEPIGGSTATKKYITELDGQDDFWSFGNGGDFGMQSSCSIGAEFVGTSVGGFDVIIGRFGSSRFYIGQGIDGGFIVGDGGRVINTGVNIADGKIHSASLAYDGVNIVSILDGVEVVNESSLWSGALDGVAVGNAVSTSFFYGGAVLSCFVNANGSADTYKLSSNLPYELPIGEEDVNATTKITLQNSEPDGSDRTLVMRKEDNSGWTDGATDYDYATGVNS